MLSFRIFWTKIAFSIRKTGLSEWQPQFWHELPFHMNIQVSVQKHGFSISAIIVWIAIYFDFDDLVLLLPKIWKLYGFPFFRFLGNLGGVFSGVRVALSCSALYIMICHFVPFSFDYCIVWPSLIYDLWIHPWYLQSFFIYQW